MIEIGFDVEPGVNGNAKFALNFNGSRQIWLAVPAKVFAGKVVTYAK